MTTASAKTPLLISLVLVIAGLIIALVSGIGGGSLIGGLIAGAGLIPACWAAWAGMQQETQASLGAALGMVFLSLGVGGLLILLWIVEWIRG